MDFTPSSNPPPIHANPISSRKLPIKRKNPNSTLILTIPNLDDHPPSHHQPNPPFKFHRVWSEPDEIRLLQGLLHSSSQGLSFPRDLGIFYAQFSDGMSQPYSKTQLSEKLRRLRKKFRVISARLVKGLDKSLLSPQDRALYDLSKQLWEPEPQPEPEADHPSYKSYQQASNHKCKSDNVVGVEVPLSSMAVLALPSVVKKTDNRDNGGDRINKGDVGLKDGFNGNDAGKVELGGDVKMVSMEVPKEVRVKDFGDELRSGIVQFATTTLVDVVDRSLKEMRRMIDMQRLSNMEKEMSFEKRWRDQHVAEFDVLAKRLKLILEGSSMVSK